MVIAQKLADISISINGVDVKPELFEQGVVESRYRAIYDDLLVLLTVRQWPDGTRWARFAVENGYINLKTNTRNYHAVVTIGDVVLDEDIAHGAHTRWTVDGWIGDHAGAYQDVDYLKSTKLVPNYVKSDTAIPGSYQQYEINGIGNHTMLMGEAGYQPQIGILPLWDASYLSSGIKAAYKSVIANAESIGSYPIIWRDRDTLEHIDLDKFSHWTVNGYKQGGESLVSGINGVWERAHFPSTGYLAYLLTGDPVHLDSLADQAALCYLVQTWNYGGGFGRERLSTGQTRGQAWCWRTIGMYAALSNDEDFIDMIAFNFEHYAGNIDKNGIGITYIGNLSAYGTAGVVAPWMHNFRVQTLGFLSDIDAVENTNSLIKLRDHNYKFITGLLSDDFCLSQASSYTLKVGPDTSTSIDDLYDDWATVYKANFNEEPCATYRVPVTATNYWANLLPAVSYAVDHNAPGARKGWAKMQAMKEFDAWMTDLKKTPGWGIMPRNIN